MRHRERDGDVPKLARRKRPGEFIAQGMIRRGDRGIRRGKVGDPNQTVAVGRVGCARIPQSE